MNEVYTDDDFNEWLLEQMPESCGGYGVMVAQEIVDLREQGSNPSSHTTKLHSAQQSSNSTKDEK